MTNIPETGFLRVSQIVGNKKTTPHVPAILPICKTRWYEGIKDGKFPAPVNLGKRTRAWPVKVIRQLVDDIASGKVVL